MITTVVIIPVLIWLLMVPFGSRISSPSFVVTSLGQLSGLIGMSLFSVTLVLSARVKFLEEYFGGQNRAYINHHILGAAAFILLIFHPLFLISKYLMISLATAFQFITPWQQDRSILLGTVGLMFMIASLFFTFYKKLPYQIWKQTHRFLGFAFFFGSLHVFFIESDVSRNLPLRYYMFVLVLMGIASLLYRVVLRKYLVKTYSYQVKAINEFGPNSREVVLTSIGEPMLYKPGQFAFFGFNSTTLSREVHPFSISSAPALVNKNDFVSVNNSIGSSDMTSHEISFVAKALGDYTNRLGELKVGDIANVEGPYGVFTLDSAELHRRIWIAGGIGITPILAMARSLDMGGNVDKYMVDLYYSVKTEDEFIFLDELSKIAKNTGKLRIFEVVTSKDGYITVEKIMKNSNIGSEVYICGPIQMMSSLRQQFLEKGVIPKHIHTEEFALQ